MKLLRRLALGLITLLLLVLLTGFIYERMGRAAALRAFPPPGKMVDIGGRSLQLDCRGSGTPLVVFESGLDFNGALAWSKVHDAVAKTTRACAYSRAGIMWSEAAARPLSGKDIANDLHQLLSRAGEAGPYVLVAHSAGGPYSLHFTKHYGKDVAGLVWVDASHPEQFQRLKDTHPENPANATLPDWPTRLGINFGLVRMKISPTFGGRPNQAAETLPAIAAFRVTSLVPMFTEFYQLNHTFPEIKDFKQLGDRPLVVLTATRQLPVEAFGSPAKAAEYDRTWHAMQAEMATWSSRSTHIKVSDAGHYIHFDQPQAVIDATASVLAMLRAK